MAADDDLPPLIGEDGQELPPEDPPVTQDSKAPQERKAAARKPQPRQEQLPEGITEEDALKAAAALHAAGRENQAKEEEVSAADAIKGVLGEVEAPKTEYKEPDEKTKRMIAAVVKDEFEECEHEIMQGADVNVDCGGGMKAIHLSALRGEVYLTELLLAHKADVNERDLSGNTPLLWSCHFLNQHRRGMQIVSQLLFHKADPHYRVKDGKLAGQTAHDIVDKICGKPCPDENVPRQVRAMLQLAEDGKEEGIDSITKVWMSFRSSNAKLESVTSKNDNYDYLMKNIAWSTPENAKNAQGFMPVKLEDAESILEEKFIYLKDYSFTDEGEKVKVYVVFPESVGSGLTEKDALEVTFDFQAFDMKLRASTGKYRLRIDPTFGSIEASECKHRISAGSKKVTLTLVKRHKGRHWGAILKPK